MQAVKAENSKRADKIFRGFYNCGTYSLFAFQTFLPVTQKIVVNFLLTPFTETKVTSFYKN